MIGNIQRTDNQEEIIKIGKQLVEENPDIYTKAEIRYLLFKIGKTKRGLDAKQRYDLLYQYVYDYWVYGVNISEEMFYDFPHINDAEKQQYLTFRNRFDYYYRMNDIHSAPLLNNKYNTYLKFKEHYKREIIQIKDESDYDTFFAFVQRHPDFVVKPSSLGLTIGIYKESIGDHKDLKMLFDKILSDGARVKEKNAWDDSWVNDHDKTVILEEIIDQHEALAQIHPQSVNGVRISTIFTKKGVSFFYPWLKIGGVGNSLQQKHLAA